MAVAVLISCNAHEQRAGTNSSSTITPENRFFGVLLSVTESARFFDGEPGASGRSRPGHIVTSLERRYRVVPDLTLRASVVNVHAVLAGSKME